MALRRAVAPKPRGIVWWVLKGGSDRKTGGKRAKAQRKRERAIQVEKPHLSTRATAFFTRWAKPVAAATLLVGAVYSLLFGVPIPLTGAEIHGVLDIWDDLQPYIEAIPLEATSMVGDAEAARGDVLLENATNTTVVWVNATEGS